MVMSIPIPLNVGFQTMFIISTLIKLGI